MSETTVDARGQMCPKPLIMTKKALAELAVGREMSVLIDNEASRRNVCRFLEDNGAEATWTEAAGVFTIRVKKTSGRTPQTKAEDYCASPARSYAIAVNNDKMGFGPDELGRMLIKAFINTIGEAPSLPGVIAFYNNGVYLAVEGSPVIDSLMELQSRGVKILVCGTCLDYFDEIGQLKVGTVSNMYDIIEALTAAGHVVVP